jgi:hypothetical protein
MILEIDELINIVLPAIDMFFPIQLPSFFSIFPMGPFQSLFLILFLSIGIPRYFCCELLAITGPGAHTGACFQPLTILALLPTFSVDEFSPCTVSLTCRRSAFPLSSPPCIYYNPHVIGVVFIINTDAHKLGPDTGRWISPEIIQWSAQVAATVSPPAENTIQSALARSI